MGSRLSRGWGRTVSLQEGNEVKGNTIRPGRMTVVKFDVGSLLDGIKASLDRIKLRPRV